MRQKSRERVVRLLFSTLVQSELSARDLRELAHELDGGSISIDLARLVRDFSDYVKRQERFDSIPNGRADLTALALELMERNKISKTRLSKIIGSLGGSAGLPKSTSMSTQDYLDLYFSRVSDSEASQLIDLLGAPADDDPYLAGIMKRQR